MPALLLLLLPVVLGAQRCQEDTECRGFRRTECTKLQPSFLNILPPHCVKYNTYTEPGRCTTVTDGLCKIGNTFRQKKARCRQTRQCANCIGDRDCYGNSFCTNGRCESPCAAAAITDHQDSVLTRACAYNIFGFFG